ncbi:rhodopsin kinase GRK7 isoform X2 [Pseudopipra pipra]|uniref:rhodopsin kinase GRK7 isoform X2 n=1 Tax=Pseudopipra pipra TaxID=415032 RepID=UPI003139B759
MKALLPPFFPLYPGMCCCRHPFQESHQENSPFLPLAILSFTHTALFSPLCNHLLALLALTWQNWPGFQILCLRVPLLTCTHSSLQWMAPSIPPGKHTSKVCAIQVKNTGKMYACKKLDKKRLKKKSGEKMALLEKEILEKVNSPFIVTLAYAYESKTHLCLVMSLMNGGDLKYHIYNVGERGLEMKRIIYYSAQITCGILHLHSINIVYRDMKPENVLLDDNGNCRLSDLGLAVQVKEGKPITQRAGTNGYMAPEILKEEDYSYPVDWFAMGCSIYEMVAGRTPFKDFKEKVNKDEVRRRTLEDEVKFEHASFTEEAKDICRLFLAKKKEDRLGSRNADDDPRKHNFFKTINFHRLEANLIDPPFVPDPSVVYAKDIGDIADFSEVRGIEFDDKDKKFFKRFATGAVPIPWQEEIIETGLFDELNDPNRVESGGYANGGEAKSGVCLLL